MSVLSEAKHQSMLSQFPDSDAFEFDQLPDDVDALREQVTALREELSQCKQALQEAANKNCADANQMMQLRQQLAQRDYLIHDLGSIAFESKMPTASSGVGYSHRIASSFAVFSADETWISKINAILPDVHCFQEISKATPDSLRTADTIWIQPKDMSYDTFWRIIIAARKSNTPVRVFPFADITSCATLLVHADISR
jgi:outer membrane murein-binding lipoprotein Lpp